MHETVVARSIDGSLHLLEQESAVLFQEAKGYELITITADQASTSNVVTFRRLAAGRLPGVLHLTTDPVPDGKSAFWAGSVYVAGRIRPASAYRN